MQSKQNPTEHVPAGEFQGWYIATTAPGRGEGSPPGDVPCGSCNACCRSSYFIHVSPEDSAARAAIPPELLFDAPGLPGHQVLGYNERGECPMLEAGQCSIYPARPETCRRYDCRVFAATGLTTGDERKLEVDARVRRWRFDLETERARSLFAQARAAARQLADAPGAFPADFVPRNNTQLAMLALELAPAVDLARWDRMSDTQRAQALIGAAKADATIASGASA
ncbi:MAG: YkgJ family cysteine cluster protein [Pseudomonadota bacterium]